MNNENAQKSVLTLPDNTIICVCGKLQKETNQDINRFCNENDVPLYFCSSKNALNLVNSFKKSSILILR